MGSALSSFNCCVGAAELLSDSVSHASSGGTSHVSTDLQNSSLLISGLQSHLVQ